MSAKMTIATLDQKTSLSIFERMLMIRHFEEAVIRLHNEGQFVSHYHIYIGQEATGGGVLEALSDGDLICTTHRNHGHIIGRGCDPGCTMAEILGRSTGFNGGRSGTLHISDTTRGFLSTSAIVGGCAGDEEGRQEQEWEGAPKASKTIESPHDDSPHDDSPVSVRRRPRPGRNAVWRRRTVIDMIVSIFDRIISRASSGCNHPDRWRICRSLGGLAVILTVASAQFSTKTESPIPPRLAPCYLS